MFDLSGKTALVTGATGGIGGGIARALHAQGATVALSGTRREALDTLAAELGERVHVLPCDLSDMDAVEKLVPDAGSGDGQARYPGRQCRHHRDNLFVQLKDDDWDQRHRRQSDRDLPSGPRRGEDDDAPPLRPHHRHHLGGRRHRQSGAGQLYRGEGRLIGMMKSIAAEYAKRNVTANCVAPGFIASPMTDKLNDKQREAHPATGFRPRSSASPPISRRRWSIWPPTRPHMSPARPSTSMAAWR